MINSALLIGCGDVGANYDFNSNEILTHAKALSKANWIKKIDLFDLNELQLEKIASNYNFNPLKFNSKINFENYDFVCISTPTNTHFEYLKACINSKVPIVLCEKPVSNSINELNEILKLYKSNKTRIIVNYFRRFQKTYFSFLKKIEFINEQPNIVKVRYNKGFLNNAGHALDIIEFFLKSPLNPTQIKIRKKEFDYFKNDPTISANFISNKINFDVIGMDLNKKIFEIEFIFNNYKIKIKDRGDTIIFYNDGKINFEIKNLIKDYMIDVYDTVKNMHINNKLNDNFTESLMLNKKQILKFL